jgi:anthranilate phosphoribosyltransferase
VQPVRIELKMRTAFNYLGPLTNPARAEIQVAGTWSDEAAEKIAGAMARLGALRAYVVHGSDGLGELTITGPSTVFAVQHGMVSRMEVVPEDFGLKPQSGEGIGGGDAEQNRAIAVSILSGVRGPGRDIVLMNAALALVAAGLAADFRGGVKLAEESIDSGAARGKLDQLREIVRVRETG